MTADLSDVIGTSLDTSGQMGPTAIPVISDGSVKDKDVSPGEMLLTGFSDAIQEFIRKNSTISLQKFYKQLIYAFQYPSLAFNYRIKQLLLHSKKGLLPIIPR